MRDQQSPVLDQVGIHSFDVDAHSYLPHANTIDCITCLQKAQQEQNS